MINLMFVSSNEPGFCYLIKDLQSSRDSTTVKIFEKTAGTL